MIRASFRDPAVRGQQIESKTGMALVRQARDSQEKRGAPLADVLVILTVAWPAACETANILPCSIADNCWRSPMNGALAMSSCSAMAVRRSMSREETIELSSVMMTVFASAVFAASNRLPLPCAAAEPYRLRKLAIV